MSSEAPAAGLEALFGPPDQISFAVVDIAETVSLLEPLFGPFDVRESVLAPGSVTYRGREGAVRLRLAICQSGAVEIELVEVLEGDWPTVDHLDRHGPGLHHVRFVVTDLDAESAEIQVAGFREVLRGVSPRGSQFAYLEAPGVLGPSMVELLQPRR
jgi:hypothetical protein